MFLIYYFCIVYTAVLLCTQKLATTDIAPILESVMLFIMGFGLIGLSAIVKGRFKNNRNAQN
ncbi:MAG: hypothetical protein GY795_46860 [Desulfobacterales bacterium]|nr:hypothetical protein [Desulfobacterales bacterium]